MFISCLRRERRFLVVIRLPSDQELLDTDEKLHDLLKHAEGPQPRLVQV